MAYHAASPYLFCCAMTRDENGHHRHSMGVSAPRHVNTDACIRFALGLVVLAASYLISLTHLCSALAFSHILRFSFSRNPCRFSFACSFATRLSDGDAFLHWSRLLADLFWLQIGHNTTTNNSHTQYSCNPASRSSTHRKRRTSKRHG